jgi:glutathione S-transferase
MELLEFTVSHFCEKARWALDHKGIRYRVVTLVPGLHLWTTRRLGLRRTQVPILKDGAELVQGSNAIVEYADRLAPERPLAPGSAEERELVARIDRDIGEALRTVVYEVMLREARGDVIRLWSQNGPRWAPLFYGVTFPVIRGRLAGLYRLHEAAAERRRFDAAFRELDARLGAGPFLSGGAFGLADIAAAALLAPLCAPPVHHVAWPARLPDELEALVETHRASRLWRWVHDLYRDHRHAPAAIASPRGT